ncbi:MAG TPA: ubiquinol-cytochrome c reductase iron-sulfur subunit [Steroidobacteraceae bacterium]|jgi:ubiquinol-cytochrome c reductase iron-sulfur subunit|nr:ubiquinol-cytochrome c reductase iron-sulfur subunit [Steroidobacteraceae bacterium]
MTEAIDKGRRQLLTAATTITGVAGVAFAAVPFLSSWKPSARAKALGAPVEIDISKLDPGAMLKIEWRGKPVLIVRRTPEMLGTLGNHDTKLADPDSDNSRQPDYAKNPARSIKPEYLVLVGVCTHLGCLPQNRFAPGASADGVLTADWPGGFFCPCHGSKFDLSGRVFAGVPAPVNLEVPPYSFSDEAHIVIGQDQAKEA